MSEFAEIDADRLRGGVRTLARLHRMLEAADSGLTLPQYRMLARLSAGGERSARLAEALTVRRPTITAVADGLVAAGLAARESDAGDRRVVRLILTDDGRAALARADEAFIASLEPILGGIAEPARFIDTLLEINEVIDARIRERKKEKAL